MHMYIRRPDVITSSKEVYENPPGKNLLMIFQWWFKLMCWCIILELS